MFADFTKTITAGIWLNGFEGEGEYKLWHDNGQLWAHCHHKNDKLDGEYKAWWKNGQLEEHCHYKNGEFDGEYKSWLENGQLYVLRYYKDGKEIKRIK